MNSKLLLSLLSLVCLGASAQQQWPDVTPEMRPGTRWWWHGSAVEAGRIDTLISQYAQAGIGTVEITPIYGVQGNQSNNLTYLSTPWMQALSAVHASSARNNINVDMNGGTGWPFGGPNVPLSQAAAKLLTQTERKENTEGSPLTWTLTPPESTATLQCVMAYCTEGAQVSTTTDTTVQEEQLDPLTFDLLPLVSNNHVQWNPPYSGKWLLVAIWSGHTLQAVKRAAPGGEGYVVDHFDTDAVSNYLQRFDQAFSRDNTQWPNSFFCDSYEVYGADWTPRMLEHFRRLRGYDLRMALPQLLALTKDSLTVQYAALPTQQAEQQAEQPESLRLGYLDVLADYRQTLADMLLESFTKPWTQWAHSHGVTTRLQAHGAPGNLLDFYAAADIPEIEGFGLTDFGIPGLRQDPGFTRQNYSDFATLKYASSAAHVAGKPLVSSETFTWLTEHFRTSLSQMKPDLDLMLAAGVNHIFFHGTAYTPDTTSQQPAAQWPGWHFYASIDMSPGNSIWRDAPAMMQYATRCQSWLQQGQPDNDFLLYANFNEAMHKNTGTFQDRLLLFDINTLSQKMPGVVIAQQAIEQAGYDCDFISDRQLLRLSIDTENTNLSSAPKLITEGGTCYRAVIITSDKYMPMSVRHHLDSLASLGAQIVYAPTLSAATLDTLGASPEPLRKAGMKVLRRKTDDGRTLRFIANLTANTYEGSLPHPATQFDPMTGTITPVSTSTDEQPWLQLRPGESVITIDNTAAVSTAAATYASTVAAPAYSLTGISAKQPMQTGSPIIIDNPWTLSFTGGTPTIQDTYLLDTLRSWEGLSEQTACYMGTGIYETTFNLSEAQVAAAPLGFRLDLGDVRESARVYLNGDSVATVWAAPFTIDIPCDNGETQQAKAAIHPGLNTLRIEVTNLPANRIAAMDRQGITWRLFEDVNMLGILNNSEGTRVDSYALWDVMPSGLNSNVRLLPLQPVDTRFVSELHGMEAVSSPEPADNQQPTGEATLYRPRYAIACAGYADNIGQVQLQSADNAAVGCVNRLNATHDTLFVVPTSDSSTDCLLRVSLYDGTVLETWLPVSDTYTRLLSQRFDGTEPPSSGWNAAIKNGMEIAGFSGEGRVEAHVAKANGKEVSTLFDGLCFSSSMSNNFYLYPGHGMQPLRACTMTAATDSNHREGDLLLLYQRRGSLTDSLMLSDVAEDVQAVTCSYAPAGMAQKLAARTDGVLYVAAEMYRPTHATISTDISIPAQNRDGRVGESRQRWYTLHGQAISTPHKAGVYIRNGRKLVIR